MMKTRGSREIIIRRRRVAALPLPLPLPLPLWCWWWFLFACTLFFFTRGGAAIGTVFGGTRGTTTDSYSQDGSTRIDVRRRQLIGPGSYLPRCTGKCSRCVPCHPVHVTVPPAVRIVAEYYPEAWRCKCGRRLYIP